MKRKMGIAIMAVLLTMAVSVPAFAGQGQQIEDSAIIGESSRYGDYYLSHASWVYENQPVREETFEFDGTEKYVLSQQTPYPFVLEFLIKGRIGDGELDPNTWYVQDYDDDFHIEFVELEDDKWVSCWHADKGKNGEKSYIGIINRWISFIDDDTFIVTTEGRNYEYVNYTWIETYKRLK